MSRFSWVKKRFFGLLCDAPAFLIISIMLLPVALTFSSGVLYAQDKEDPLKVAQANERVSAYARKVANRNKLTVSVISGEVASTYLQMAADMANAFDETGSASKEALRIVPIVGKGGIQNVLDILYLKGIDMGMIQQGQLSYLQRINPDLYKNIKSRIAYVAKLYNAEFHLLANKSVKSIRSLDGQRVSFGKRLGSTDIIAQTLFKRLDINVKVVHDDLALSIEKLKNGQIAAVAVLGGAPIQGLNDVTLANEFHFLPVSPKTAGMKKYFQLIDEFLPIKITHDNYPGLIDEGSYIPSIASGVILVCYNWKPKTARYEKLNLFVDRFFSQFDALLRPSRHPKWREVSVFAKVPGWRRFGPAETWLRERRQEIGQEVSAGEMKIAMDSFVRQYAMVGNNEEITPLQRDDIWAAMQRVFGRWWVISDDR